MHDTECAACHRTFTAKSKPRFSFTREGRPNGQVHAAPCIPGRNRTHITLGYARTLERAQFDFWLIYVYPRPERGIAAWDAFMLAEEPNETLSKRQENLLRAWALRQNEPRSAAQIQSAREAHAALIGEYRAWLADHGPVGQNGCS